MSSEKSINAYSDSKVASGASLIGGGMFPKMTTTAPSKTMGGKRKTNKSNGSKSKGGKSKSKKSKKSKSKKSKRRM
jgi:hypothetical protein